MNPFEQAIVGTLLEANGDPLPATLQRLLDNAPESFSDERLGAIVATVKKLRDQGGAHTADFVVVALGKDAPEGAELLLGELPDKALPIDLAEHEAQNLWEFFAQGKIATVLKDAAEYVIQNPSAAKLIATTTRLALDGLDVEQTSERYEQRSIGDLQTESEDNGGELIRHRFLCRGGGLLLAAPTGIGKSVLALQAQLCFAVGRPCLGFEPASQLRSLYLQAENDDGDLRELRDGILTGLRFTEEQRHLAFQNVHFVTVDDKCGPAFISEAVAPLVKASKPDLVWIDPLLSFIGGDIARQDVVSPWLRNHLNPVLHRYQVGTVVIHHTNKPPSGKEKPDWQAGDFAYLGSGSAELANWPRAVVAIRSTGSHEVFELRLGKRGARVGWKAAGERTYSKHIAHGKDGIYWREAEPEEVPTTGRKARYTVKDVVAVLSGEMTAKEWQERASEETGMSRAKFYELKREAAGDKLVVLSKVTGKWITA